MECEHLGHPALADEPMAGVRARSGDRVSPALDSLYRAVEGPDR